MKQLGLVTYYGSKPPHFKNLIEQCQKLIIEVLGQDFTPYKVEQVHGTLISLERLDKDGFYSLQYYATSKKKLKMDIIGYLEYLKNASIFPITVQLGGFRRDDIPFLSLGLSPYERSFSFQGIKAIILGWPVIKSEAGSVGTKLSDVLGKIRVAGEEFNLRHTYNQLDFIDTEYYLRLGLSQKNAPKSIYQATEDRVRDYLSRIDPVIIEISIADLSVVCYQDDTLPLSSTKTLPLSSISTIDDIARLLL
jgi:hypothetical protein